MTKQIQRRLFVPESQHYELLKLCETIARDAANVVVSLASINKRPAAHHEATTQYQQLRLETELAQRFQKISATTLNDVLTRLEDGGSFADYYSDSDLGEDELWYLKITDGGRIAKQIVPLADAKDLDVYSERQDFVKGLRYYVISLQPKSAPGAQFLHAFRFLSEGFQLNRKKWAMVRSARGQGYYDDVKEDGFLFDFEVDCFCYGHDMFVLNRDKFQHIFRFYDRVQEDAQRVIYGMQKRVPISNLDEFIAACSRDSRMAVKVADLEDQPYAQSLTMDLVKRNIRQEKVPVDIIEQDNQEMLVYSSAHKWEFLHLLSDDFLESPMTGLHYKVNGKAYRSSGSRQSEQQSVPTQRKRSNPRRRLNGRRVSSVGADTATTVTLADVDA